MFLPFDLQLVTNLALACAAVAGALLPSAERTAAAGDAERSKQTGAADERPATPPTELF